VTRIWIARLRLEGDERSGKCGAAWLTSHASLYLGNAISINKKAPAEGSG